jgi:hypothetical protein
MQRPGANQIPEQDDVLKNPQSTEKVVGKLCTFSDFNAPYFAKRVDELKESFATHRKLWEYVEMVQALDDLGMLEPGAEGLGFAVGNEPLSAYFASRGCQIVATDQGDGGRSAKYWKTDGMLCSELQNLNQRQICDQDKFSELVTYRDVDMNQIPDDLKKAQFDFTWSSCSFEHLGSLQKGLKPGGFAVHTTEFNCFSNDITLNEEHVVAYRKRDMEYLEGALRQSGSYLFPINYDLGTHQFDRDIDIAPYRRSPHIKLQVDGHVLSSLLLVARRLK